MEHKQDKIVGSYWVGNCEVSVSLVWRGWDYRDGHTYCKREDYTQEGDRWVHVFYDNPIAESEWEKTYYELQNECARRNAD